MIRTLLILLACALHAGAADAPKAEPLADGKYVGLEPMTGYKDPEHPKAKWFHENDLIIQGSAVTLEKSPVWFLKGKKWSSSSDGGFYTYRGTLRQVDGQWQMDLLKIASDYAAVPLDKDGKPIPPKPELFTVTRNKDGSLVVNKVTYRKEKAQ